MITVTLFTGHIFVMIQGYHFLSWPKAELSKAGLSKTAVVVILYKIWTIMMSTFLESSHESSLQISTFAAVHHFFFEGHKKDGPTPDS